MTKTPWKRLLYLKQDYPDNYTDPDFVKRLADFEKNRRNYENSPYSTEENHRRVHNDFLGFYNQILNTSFIFIIFAYIKHYNQNPVYLTILVTAITVFTVLKKKDELDSESPLLNVKSLIVLTFTMLTLSPVLKSLSESTASDSIWTISFWLTLAYISSISSTKGKTSNVSTNLLVAVVSVLASRLSTTTYVFCFLYQCIQINVVLPKLLPTTPIIFIVSNAIVYTFITQTLGWIYTVHILLVSVLYITLLPRWFIYWQIHYRRIDDDVHEDSNSWFLTSWDARKPIID